MVLLEQSSPRLGEVAARPAAVDATLERCEAESVELIRFDARAVSGSLMALPSHWFAHATAGWLRVAACAGLHGEECTYDVLDSRRDGDPEYSGSVLVRGMLLDLIIDGDGRVQVVTDGRYYL
jgi:hypothetical protein